MINIKQDEVQVTLFISRQYLMDLRTRQLLLRSGSYIRTACGMHVSMCREAYLDVQNSIRSKGPLRGALFWQWSSDNQRTSSRSVLSSDSTFGCSVRAARA